jgi:hypothetical protein
LATANDRDEQIAEKDSQLRRTLPRFCSIAWFAKSIITYSSPPLEPDGDSTPLPLGLHHRRDTPHLTLVFACGAEQAFNLHPAGFLKAASRKDAPASVANRLAPRLHKLKQLTRLQEQLWHFGDRRAIGSKDARLIPAEPKKT